MRQSAKQKKTSGVAAQILDGLREAIAFERGELKGVRVDRIPSTARHVSASAAPSLKPDQIIDLRKNRMGVSQAVFAHALNVSPETVRAWEQGKNTPGGPALRLLEIAEEQPELVLKRVHLSGLDREGQYRTPGNRVTLLTSDSPATRAKSVAHKAARKK